VFCGGNFSRVGNTDVCYNWGSFEEKWREILIKKKQEPRSGTGSSFKIFLPKQHLHESQGCQVAVATAPLLKSGRRKFLGAVENWGPWGAVKGPPRGQKG
jgi:hypothetical protein